MKPQKNESLIEQKQQQIIDGACKEFFQKGYHRTTIREIAIAANMSIGQLYHYISSKDDVLFLVYQRMQRVWYDHLVQSGVEKIKNPTLRLTRAIRYTIEFMIKNKDLILFIYTETKYLEKKQLDVVKEIDDKIIVGYWRKLLKNTNITLSNGRDADFLANLISFMMVFFPLRGWNIKENLNKNHSNYLVDFILRGLGLIPEGK